MRIVHVSTSDCSGGAARSAERLHEGLRRMGEDSRMFVAQRRGCDPGVVEFVPSKKPVNWLLRTARGVRIGRAALRARQAAVPAWSMMSDDRTIYANEPWGQCPQAEVFQLHWVSGFLDYRSFFRWLPRGTPVVWTLHDMNPFTGGCHYDSGCGRFSKECGCCPQLGSSHESDLSREIIGRKRRSLAPLAQDQLHIVAPSRWLGEQATSSALFSRFPRSIIPYGVDTELFRPRARRAMREALDIPIDASVLLFIANGVNDPRKGFDYLARAFDAPQPRHEFVVLSVGPGRPAEFRNVRHVHVEDTQDDRLLSSIYTSADVLITPSLQDNLPNTVLEAMACGTPIVAFAAGGIPEAVRHGETGLLASVGDVKELRLAVFELLENESKRAEISRRCREVAVEEYGLDLQARRYLHLYETLTSKKSADPGAMKGRSLAATENCVIGAQR